MNYDKPIEGHCEGCDSSRLDVREYYFKTPFGEEGFAFWCRDCATIAAFNGPVGAISGGNYDVEEIPPPDPDIRRGGKHEGDPWCDPSVR